MPVADVAVVGAGPAGCAAAVTLARAGRTVVLLDKARFPRDKCCGDGLTTGALRELERLGLDPASVGSWQRVEDVVVRSPSGREVRFPLPRDGGTFAAVARRADLDAALVELARRAGVEVREGVAVTGVEQDAGSVRLDVDAGDSVRAPYVLAADGMWSPVRRMVGLARPDYRGEWHAFRQYFEHVGPRAASELFVWFEPDLLPGYAWSFPLPGGRANVGFGIARDGGKVARVQDMAGLWRDLLTRPHVRAVLGPDAAAEGPHRAWPIPAAVDRQARHAGRVLLAGDAAAVTDPLTGEGIGQALLTGRLAAEAVLRAGPNAPEEAAADYDRAVERALVADHRLAALLQRVLGHDRAARGAVKVAGASDWTRRNFARWLFEDYPRAVLATPRRWHRRMLTGPGAFQPSRPGHTQETRHP